MTSTRIRAIRGFAAAAVFLVGATAMADAKAPPAAEAEEGYGNNLSVPALFVPDQTTAPALRLPGVTAATAPVAIGGQPVYYDEIVFTDTDGNVTIVPAGYYFEQKTEAAWQADWSTAPTATVVADWGDNLTDAPNLKARQPLRVEMTLFQDGVTATGLRVVKLTDELDRYATYGTDGVLTAEMPVRVFDAGATLSIRNVGTGAWVLGDETGGVPMSVEVNSTGGLVYGFNWGIQGRKSTPVAGTYELVFTTNATTIVGIEDVDAIRVPEWTEDSTTLTITLSTRNNPGGGTPGGGGGDHAGGGR
jgi:hypothetical protein